MKNILKRTRFPIIWVALGSMFMGLNLLISIPSMVKIIGIVMTVIGAIGLLLGVKRFY